MATHAPARGEPRQLGSTTEAGYAKQGANFISPVIATLAFRESVYREIGAVIEQERLWTNMLSSQPLCFNLFGDLKLNPDKGNKFFQHLFPDYVAAVSYTHLDVYKRQDDADGNATDTDTAVTNAAANDSPGEDANKAGSSKDFRGQSRSNDTHASKTDPDSRLYRKGKTASELRFMGHTLMENRNGLIVNATVTQADGHAERVAAKAMINDARQALSLIHI